MKALFLDAGSTFVKYAFRDRADGRIEPQPSVPFPAPVLDDGARYEVAEPSIRSVILGILEEARAHGCTSAFISVQMHGHLLRSPDGVFSNYVSWKDRSGDIGHPLLKAVDFAERGTSRKPNLPLARLCNDKESLSGTEFFTLGSYIAYLLTGRNVTHSTDGCASGLFHAQTLLPLSPFDGMRLPEVLRRVEPIGACGEITVYAPMGDHQISFLGSGAGEDDLLLNIGTATQLSTLGSAASCPPSAEARPWFDERRLLTVTNLTRGEQLFAGYSPALSLPGKSLPRSTGSRPKSACCWAAAAPDSLTTASQRRLLRAASNAY